MRIGQPHKEKKKKKEAQLPANERLKDEFKTNPF